MCRNYCKSSEKQVQEYNVCGKFVHVGVRLKRCMWHFKSTHQFINLMVKDREMLYFDTTQQISEMGKGGGSPILFSINGR